MSGEAASVAERRLTRQRSAVARAVAGMPGAFTVDELVRAASSLEPGIGTATVYRAVAALVRDGELEPVGERDGRVLYARCSAAHHHHHLVCTGCGSTVEATCPLSDGGMLEAAEREGFAVTGHELRVYGLCRACRGGEVA